MNFTKSYQKLKKTAFSRGAVASRTKGTPRATTGERTLQFDLFAQLSYMSAVATAGVSRAQLFDHAAQLPFASSRYFKDINTLSKKLNTDYSESCRLVAEGTKRYEVRALLLRMAGSLSAGEREDEFLRREAEIIGENYGNQYERDVESLRKWTDAYVTLLVASSLIVIVAVISMMIYQVGVGIIVTLAMMMVLATCLGAWIIYASSPREIKTRISGPSSRLQLMSVKLFKTLVPAGIATCSAMLFLGLDLGWILIVGAIFIFPTGYVIARDDGAITRKDGDIASVVRVLGGVTSALSTTLTVALASIDRRSMGHLMPEITRLNHRLNAGIDPSLCWDALVDETGSELIARTVTMFYNPLSLGGDPARVGTASAFFSSRIAFLRASRTMVASTFRYLTLPLHAAMVGLLEFIVEIMTLFSTKVDDSAISGDALSNLSTNFSTDELFTFGQVNIQLVEFLVTFVVLVLTAANAFAPKWADGGHNFKILHNASITMAITGLLVLAIPIFAHAMFKSIVDT